MTTTSLVVATGLYPPDIGGPATYAVLLETELPAHSIEVTTVPFTSVRHLPKVVRHLVYTWRLWRAARSSDCLLALDPVSVGVPALLVSKLRRLPFLVRLGGDYAWEQGRQRYGIEMTLDEYAEARDRAPRAVRLLHRVQRAVVARAKEVIVPSAYLQSIVAGWGIAPDKIAVVHSAVALSTPGESKVEARRRLGWTDFTLVTAARLTPWKGVAALIEVVAALREAGIMVKLCVIGTGPEEVSLKKQVATLQLEDAVQFTSQLPKPELYEKVFAADVFVLNTAYEGLSHQLLEAMLLGTPIITTPVGGNPELITDEVTGRLVPYDDVPAWSAAVRELKQNQDIAITRALKAKEHAVTSFDSDKSVRETVAIINQYAD